MKRLAALFLAVWLLLLMGCAASRQLEQVCGAENWSSVQLVERYDRAGEEAVPLSPGCGQSGGASGAAARSIRKARLCVRTASRAVHPALPVL